jgi:hypothetical protein
MMISISTSGGIGGFGLKRSVTVEVERLAEPMRAEACARLDAGALAALERSAPDGAADAIVYHVEIEEAGRIVVFDLPETALPAETLDLIDDLMAGGAAP